ncbi:MAG: hypothetical protein AVDCRST_MAG77-577 [uncultured Chloroflexi bacterium]|uniref:HTH luxR-type domain-containing protein n=1 Tax=uncultured Chloroflexota bacterium TaxID=166587 RepID=A0A6J4HFI7_9CHLR|nr:MAG: hypothetical protein AVDCRST_MAG77-577 [uncultured Chloroflexota bacterium]
MSKPADLPREPRGGAPALLTSRELLVLLLLARRYSREQVADMLGGEAAVADALASAVRALGATDVAEAIAIARERGLIR